MSKAIKQLILSQGIGAVLDDPITGYHACKSMAKGYSASLNFPDEQVTHAQSFCCISVTAFWRAICKRNDAQLPVKSHSFMLAPLPADVIHIAESVGEIVSRFPIEQAGYLIGSIYTVMLPPSVRSTLGAYYTPPSLVTHLLKQAEAAGFNFSTGSAIDPACGGGAFLIPLALKMIQSDEGRSAIWTLTRLKRQLKGIEIDPFAAWISSVLLEASLLPLCVAANHRLDGIVVVGDALKQDKNDCFDLVIGNPPYGRIKLEPEMRDLYARSLYGHANLYGLFTDLALRMLKPAGVLAFLTPTSFLGGQYFKSLRKLLTTEAHPVSVDFVLDREGVFDDVLQETILTTYTKTASKNDVKISTIIPESLDFASSCFIGETEVNATGEPWLFPRATSDASFFHAIADMPTRLADLGFAVSTGQLVWNRHKDQLKNDNKNGELPLIWAESVTSDGFEFKATRKNHQPFVSVGTKQSHLITKNESILIQRTTSKEQSRRLLVAVLPQDFINYHGGAVIENHLNIVYPRTDTAPQISLTTLAALLSTKVVDRVYRCISGSVAVSAYELNALPLPSSKQLLELEFVLQGNADELFIERKVASFYGDI